VPPSSPPSRPDLTSAASGTLLGSRYLLDGVLGAGGMATVFDALDERLERRVAVKVLRPEMSARADVRARFEAEARSAARLTHPNVVAVFDSGEDDGVPYLVMERLPGETLADRMQAGDLDTDWVLRVAGDVLGALGAAHAAGIVHRDVKPGNILLAVDGCAKVGDFGIAKSLEVAAAADLTSTNQLLGTPAYVAPERISGQSATTKSDLYAVGIVLYEALGGRKPFTGNTPVATAYAIQHTSPAPLGELRPDLPPHLVAAIERAIAREPGDRFDTAAEMAEALRVGVAGVPERPPADATVLAVPISATQVLPAIAPAAAPPAVERGAVPLPAAFRDRRRLLMIAAAGLVLALLLLALATAGGDSGDGADTPATTPGSAPTTVTTAAPETTVPVTEPAPAPAPARAKGKGKKHDD
jgi:non-specific serine/threonine protein kinase/serine/threonine-protein kinase